MAATGVITDVILNFVTGYLTAQAQKAARAEIQKTLTLLLEQNTSAKTAPPPIPSQNFSTVL